MSTVSDIREQRVLLRSVSWDEYIALSDNSDRAGRRMTFDRGQLEIMSPSKTHEWHKTLLGRMIEMFSFHHNIDVYSTASTTFRRGDLERGFEADESYYIANEAVARAKAEIDLMVDPPPDLVVEVEISRPGINKLALLAEIGVPEVWRYNGKTLWLGRLVDGDYQQIETSVVLLNFPVVEAEKTLRAIGTASETQLIRQFVATL